MPDKSPRSREPSQATTRGLRRMGLRAAVGTVAHAVLERRFASYEEFANAWATESTRAYKDLKREWTPALPPTPQTGQRGLSLNIRSLDV
jgi:hypothetical protein